MVGRFWFIYINIIIQTCGICEHYGNSVPCLPTLRRRLQPGEEKRRRECQRHVHPTTMHSCRPRHSRGRRRPRLYQCGPGDGEAAESWNVGPVHVQTSVAPVEPTPAPSGPWAQQGRFVWGADVVQSTSLDLHDAGVRFASDAPRHAGRPA